MFVGLSGGVDSSVSLALLVQAGFDVTGVFIKSWHPDWFECNWKTDRRDAMRVCARLNVPFITLDLEKEYKKEVIDFMIREYKKGRTPNPDVMCNKEIKFGAFLKYAIKQGADFVATGHYAQVKKINNLHTLIASKDKEKDQTYFLWTLRSDQLERVLFPVGHLTKSKVRILAKKFNLPTAEKKDSQGLCFVGNIDMKEFLSHYIKSKKGNVLDINGKVIGTHDGAVFLTIGQRHGFKVNNTKTSNKPLYIVAKDIKKNTITVSHLAPSEINEVGTKKVILEDTNWTQIPRDDSTYSVRIRYRQKLLPATISNIGNKWVCNFKSEITGVSSGQSLVAYSGENCIGGGVIK